MGLNIGESLTNSFFNQVIPDLTFLFSRFSGVSQLKLHVALLLVLLLAFPVAICTASGTARRILSLAAQLPVQQAVRPAEWPAVWLAFARNLANVRCTLFTYHFRSRSSIFSTFFSIFSQAGRHEFFDEQLLLYEK